MFSSTQLSTRTDQVALPGSQALRRSYDLLHAEAGADAWRIVELSSRDGLPFEARLSWAAGNGSGADARLTVAHAARVCVWARSVALQVRNLSAGDNNVLATVADGFTPTENQLEVTGRAEIERPNAIRVPSFARTVRIDAAAGLAGGKLKLFDGQRVLRCVLPLDAQPAGGVPIGGASLVELELPCPGDWRAVFGLAL